MSDHHGEPTEHAGEEGAEAPAEERFARPDQAEPRGNQEVEEIDVERGREKIERVSGN